VGPKHVEIQQYTNKVVTSVGFHSISISDIYSAIQRVHSDQPTNQQFTTAQFKHFPLALEDR